MLPGILKRRTTFLVFGFTFFIQLNCTTKSKILRSKELNYPSGSALEYQDNKLYLVGDDARNILVLNVDFEVQDSINLVETQEQRISKNKKSDFESITSTHIAGIPHLLVIGSGSFDTIRSKGVLINIKTKQKTQFRLDTFYSRIRASGIKELNIEGLCKSNKGFIIGNRGNTSYPENHLIITSDNFWNEQDKAIIKIIKLETGADNKFFSGISGLDYSAKKDLLIISMSSENTANSYDDGEIGKSYLWIVRDVSSKENNTLVKPDAIIDLNELDKAFTGHKIESVCIISESLNEFKLALAADDDKGTSLLFSILLTGSDSILN